jgi:cytochrome d ubiquinol oxidase subunit I
VLLVIEMKLLLKAIQAGPEPDHEPEARLIPAKLVAAE